MHTYSINNKERLNRIIVLIIVSIILTPIFNEILGIFINFFCKNEKILEIVNILEKFGYGIKQFPILFVFGVLYYLFDNVLWNKRIFKFRFSNIPNLSGKWSGKYKSSWKNTEGEVELYIKQTWTKIQIVSYNKKSKSYSRVASLLTDTNKNVELVFEYENEPGSNRDSGMNPHRGFSELIYDENMKKLEGYYTGDYRTRKAHGNIWYEKE